MSPIAGLLSCNFHGLWLVDYCKLPKAVYWSCLALSQCVLRIVLQEVAEEVAQQVEEEYATMRSMIQTILEGGQELVGDDEFGDDQPLL